MSKIESTRQFSFIGMALTVIFVGLGVGATVWLGFFITHHQWQRQLSQEVRGVEWVGEKELPKAPIIVTVHNAGCVHIERAVVNSDHVEIKFRRVCGSSGDYSIFRWREKANNTVIAADWTNHGFNEMATGEDFDWKPEEWTLDTIDPRATELVLETSER